MSIKASLALQLLCCVCQVACLINSVAADKQDRFVADGEIEILKLKQEIEHLKSSIGFMAGTSNSDSGTAANYLCLPSDPSWDYYEDDLQNGILITGIQYEFNPHLGTDAAKFFGANIRGAEAPCSVCHTARSTTVMIPGRTDCYSGWTKEYSGYLVGGYPNYHHSSEYVCLDRRPEMVPQSGSWNHENMLYFVEGKCGQNLACPPYVHGRELACVVCSI